MAINILDSFIINRISAGEVVESPFSIVKELLDNALDAGADKISIEIKNGGIDYIKVKDNGCGIEYDDIKKAFLPHATSKISGVEDLEHIATLGFRGEALASISNVSHTKMTTKRAESDCAYMIEINGGAFGDITPTSLDCGTTIEVSDLFYNTPARRKFLAKPKTEENKITNIISRYILANPNISIKYIVDGTTIYQTQGKGLFDSIYSVYGIETTQNILEVSNTHENIKLSGYVSKVGFSKPNTNYQTLIVNNRYVIDETVSKAAYMAFEEYLMPRQFPFYVLRIDLPNIDLDVNVHPNKLNIKFSNPHRIYDLVYSSIREAIYRSLNPSTKPTEEVPVLDNLINSQDDITYDIAPNTKESSRLVFKQESYSPITMFDVHKVSDTTPITNNIIDTEPVSSIAEDNNALESIEKYEITTPHIADEYVAPQNVIDFKIIGELFNEFIVLEKGDTMLLMDFHAGHERLNYDKFTKIVEARDVVVQDLLVPYTQEMTREELEFIFTLEQELNELGFDISSLSDRKLVINSIPMQLKDINLKNFVDDLIHDLKNLKPSMNNEIRHYLMQKACKSSVKSGMILTKEEISELLNNLDINNPVLLCPHGRPIFTAIKKSQIEKWFKRIV